MPIDKVSNLMPASDMLDMLGDSPDIEIILEDDGSAIIELGEEDDDEVGVEENAGTIEVKRTSKGKWLEVDPEETDICTACHNEFRRIWTSPAVTFKGKGFYSNGG